MPAYKDNKTGKWFCKFYYTDWQGQQPAEVETGFRHQKGNPGIQKGFS